MTEQQKAYSCISNRWVNTIFRGYGVIKQRIFREIIEQLQVPIKSNFQTRSPIVMSDPYLTVDLDMSRVMKHNNYYQVRKALDQMYKDQIDIYADPTYKNFKPENFIKGTLLHAWKEHKGRYVKLGIKKNIAELLLNLDRKNASTAVQFTLFTPLKNLELTCKYTYPLHMLLASYANRSGFSMKLDEFRTRLQIDEMYTGFDNVNKKILKPVQEKLKIFGDHCFSFTPIKTGKEVTSLVFKIWPNKNKMNEDHIWLKIQKRIQEEYEHFKKFSPEELYKFDYLLTGKYNLNEVYDKLEYVHKAVVKQKARDSRLIPNVFVYLLKALHNDFPPPG